MSKLLHRSLEAKLAALDGPEWGSSDDEEIDTQKEEQSNKNKTDKKKNNTKDTPSTSSNNNKTKKNNNQDKKEKPSNIIYIGHIPPAFEETEILSFFSQFGRITNVKLSRAKRTGNPRGYAFVQFEDADVAAIVADTMSGYFLKGERRIVCHVLPKEKVHDKLFQGAKRNLQLCQSGLTCADKIEYWQDKERERVNKTRSMEGIQKITKRLLSREKKKREQLKMMGIDYDFPGYEASAKAVAKEQQKKRKVSVDENEDDAKDDKVTPTKSASKKTKQSGTSTTATSATKRKISIDKKEEEVATINAKPDKSTRNKSVEAESDIKKKKKTNKKRRKST